MTDISKKSKGLFEEIRYDAENKELEIKFKRSGGTHIYKNVPEEIAKNIENSTNQRLYFYTKIKGQYQHSRVIKDSSERYNRWNDLNVPNKDWNEVDMEDLEEPSEICEMCDKNEIRYVHIMEHKDYKETLRVGKICAGNMEGSLQNAYKREKSFASRVKRMKNFMKAEWMFDLAMNRKYRNHRGYKLEIYKDGQEIKGVVENRKTKKKIKSKETYKTEEGIKKNMFYLLEVKLYPDEEYQIKKFRAFYEKN